MSRRALFNYDTLVHATAGATGSIFASACFYPLDNLKFRMQAGDEGIVDKSTISALLYLLEKEGIISWYRGLKPVLTSYGISNFIYFYSFHGLKSLLPKKLEVTAKVDLALSIAAGVVNVMLTTPLWVVNSRLKVKTDNSYTGLLDGLIHIASTEGISSLWSGYGASLVLVSNPAIHFTVYEALKRKITLKSASAFFIIGAISKTIATIATYPLQLAQTRQRLSKDSNVNTIALLFAILKRNGPGALYQGMESKILQSVLSAALMFMAYEKVAQFVFLLLLRKRNP